MPIDDCEENTIDPFAQTLKKYIDTHFPHNPVRKSKKTGKDIIGNVGKFARYIGRNRSRVREMIDKDYIVVDGWAYSKRFAIPPLNKK